MRTLRRWAGALSLASLLGACDSLSPTQTGLVILQPGSSSAPATPSGSGGAESSTASGEAAVRPLAEAQASKMGLPQGLVLGVIAQESGFNSRALSPAGAQGLMQLMPGTVQHINSAGEVSVLDPFDPAQNLAGGCWYLKWVRSQVPDARVQVGEEWKFTLGGYNAGIGRVKQAIDRALSGAPLSPRAAWADVATSLPIETQAYVPAVMARWGRYK